MEDKHLFKRYNAKQIGTTAIAGGIGFLLSPLSWWNDLLINIPLAYVMTWPIAKLLSLFIEIRAPLFLFFIIINYWITNLLGFVLLHYSYLKLKNTPETKPPLRLKSMVSWSLVYTVLIAFFVLQTDISSWLQYIWIIPAWVTM